MVLRGVIILAAVISAVMSVPSLSTIDHINSVQNSWRAEINKFSDKSLEYKKKLCGALISDPEDRLPEKEEDEIITDIPAAFDARQQWPNCPSINSIKNQGYCGSCWAVGAASSLSDRLCIASDNRIKVNISIENLMTCCSKCVYISACGGGYPDRAWAYIQSTGLVTGGDYDSHEGCQPYQIPPSESENNGENPLTCSKTCTNKKYGRPYNKDLHFGKNAYTLKPKSVSAIQNDLLKHGPLEATFDVYGDFLSYSSGVYKHTSGILVGRHAVRVLGWGTENNLPYWLAANSWGRDWGDNGFFKILRGKNECKFEQFVTAGLVKLH